MPDLLFEIGVEDLPARFVGVAQQFLQQQIPKQLSQLRLQHGAAQVQATPRRLVSIVRDVAAVQSDQQEMLLGPAQAIAWEAGDTADTRKLSKAGLGFLRNAAAQQSDLITQQTAKGPVIAVRKLHKGQAACAVLPAALQQLMTQIPFAKTMRWESSQARFGRPVRWIVCMLDKQVLPLQFADVHSGNCTYAHRFLSPQPLQISSVQQYQEALKQGHVMLDTQQRKRTIVQQCQQLAQQVNGRLHEDEELLDTVSQLLEWPWVVLGQFDPDFLQIPHAILLCEMQQHQKCFAVVDSQGELLPYFLVVCGTQPTDVQQAANGNEKVIAARFADGAFYYKKDCRSSLQQHSQQLRKQVFARNLGSMQDKLQRMVALSHWLCQQLQLSADQCKQVQRVAQLCKADLATGVVAEFPKLQGVMGSVYAQRDGEDAQVVQGIAQHDWPRFAGDVLPHSEVAAVVGMADRLDTLVGILSKTKTVSGSNDPFGLRRCAIALARVVLARGYRLNLQAALQQALQHYGTLLQTDPQPLLKRAQQFIEDRMAAACNTHEQTIQPALLQAVFAASESGNDLLDAWARAHILQQWRNHDKTAFDQVAATFKRVSNLLSSPQGRAAAQVVSSNNQANQSSQLCTTAAATAKDAEDTENPEKKLLLQLQQLQQWLAQQESHRLNKDELVTHYEQLLQRVVQIKPTVDQFFDAVMVLHKDPQVRQVRVALLIQLQQPLSQLADFHRLASLT
ncbi:MAG: glycine--tRNA ligase subunit beta [Myxococcota bacterium]